MTTAVRNDIFLEHKNLIRFTIRKNMPLIRALHLDIEDVSQELSICALRAIEAFDAARGKTLKNFIIYKLQFEIIGIKNKNTRKCRIANLRAISLDSACTNEDSEEIGIEIPITVDYDSNLFAQNIFSLLSDNEKDVLLRRLSGAKLTDKKQERYMECIKQKVYRFYVLPDRKAAT